MSLSVREITPQQFADGTTIDGVRVDRAIGDFVALWNNIPKRMLKGRFVENTLVGGYMPHPTYVSDKFPWQPAHNSINPSDIVTGRGPPDSLGVANEWRNKGFRVDGIDLERPDPVMNQSVLMWTSSFWFDKPKVLNGVFLNMATDSVYTNNFAYGATPPPGQSNGNPSQDVFLEVAIKNAFLSGDRSLDDAPWHRIRFRVNAAFSTITSWVAVSDTMLPAHPEGVPCRKSVGPAASPWVSIDARHLNIPVPARSNVRFTIGIPWYVTYTSGWGNVHPQNMQYYTWALNVLEEIF